MDDKLRASSNGPQWSDGRELSEEQVRSCWRGDQDGYPDFAEMTNALNNLLLSEPFAYMCPANCGCTWRDNHDGSMSLFGKQSQSCEICEHLPLGKLVPVWKAEGGQ